MNDSENSKERSSSSGEELIYTYNRELFYHFDKEKGFTQSVNYQNPNNQIIIKQSWDVAAERLEEIRRMVAGGKLSPIAYHMERILMEVPMLADYMGIAKWRVRRHLKPDVFRKLSQKMLEKYASVFETKVSDLIDFNIPPKTTENS
jgi:hypothetical protein